MEQETGVQSGPVGNRWGWFSF